MTDIVQVAKGLKRTSKGNLRCYVKDFEDIPSELNKFIYLSIQPSKYSKYEEGNKEKVASTRNSSAEKEKTKINDAHKSSQIPDRNFANSYAEVEQERIKYDLRLKEFVKKQVADKKRSWEKYEQLCEKNEEKRELLSKEELDKSRESANSCVQVTEDLCHNVPVPELIKPEQETEQKIEEIVQNDTVTSNDIDERHLLCRRELEEALNELNSVLSMIIQKTHSHPQFDIQQIDSSIQFMKSKQHTIDSNEEVVPSDIEMALSHLSILKQVLQFLNDIPIEKEPVASSEADCSENSIKPRSPEHTEAEKFVTNKDVLPDNVPISQEEIDTPVSFDPTRSINVVPEQTDPSYLNPFIPNISAPIVIRPVSPLGFDKPTVLQSSSSLQSTPSSQPFLQPLPEVEIQDISEKKTQIEEMDSLSVSSASIHEDNYNEHALSEYVPREALKKYLALEALLKKWHTCFEVVVSSPEWKKRRLDLQKAINTPLNTMSDRSGTHLLDKLQRLSKFLSGKDVQVTGQTISINIAPEAKYFCMDLLAEKLVSQGENQVSSSYTDAFPLAVATVHLWQQFPDFGMLFMAHIHQKCPYLVPYYIPRQENQTEEEYYKSLGYTYSNGIIEEKHHFLKRMTGIVRLYAAVIQTQPISKKPHPHGVGHGWMWLAHIMNLEPRPDITATVLFHFLEVCGHALQKVYGKQFEKLLLTLADEFVPKIRKTTGGLGTFLRLEDFIKEVLHQGFVSPPAGVITDDFWRT